MKIGINGFGRIGRLLFRALWGRPGIELVHVNEPAGDAATAAHLLAFDALGLTRVVIDGFRNDLRRVRSCLNSPILTSTGSEGRSG